MDRGIRHFMWGYQVHFRCGAEVHARSIFQSLDPRLDPEAFVVGVLAQDRQDRYPACVEPEDRFWIASEAFNSVLERANEIIPTYPESEILHSHPLAQKWHEERLFKRAVQDAIAEFVTACCTKPEGMRYFVSRPVPLEGFLVSLVVGLQEEVIDSHPCLTTDRLQLHPHRTFKVPVSLTDAVMDEYLRDAAGELAKPDPGSDPLAGKSADEILRAAGQRMMAGVAQRADTWDKQEGRETELFDVCNRIAATKYERAAGRGRLILARRDHPSVTAAVDFREPVRLHNRRAARKLLELASRDMALHMNARDIWGLARLGGYTGGPEDLYEIRIVDHYQWELLHAGAVLMHARDGVPALPRPTVDHAKLRTDLRRIFKGISSERIKCIIALLDAAAEEEHGTMLVISGRASEEAKRLMNQSTALEPCKLTPGLLQQLTPIDGAVLLDLDGVCHAIGAILDGLADKAGDPARGARYNSALRYVATREEACMAVVVSEDGGVDVVPDLRPPIQRTDVEQVIAELSTILDAPSLDRRRYVKLVHWLEGHAFYLLPKHCQEANDLVTAIDERLDREEPDGIHIVRGGFTPHPDLDPSLYYKEELPP